jgi:hypothetical protein
MGMLSSFDALLWLIFFFLSFKFDTNDTWVSQGLFGRARDMTEWHAAHYIRGYDKHGWSDLA